MIQCFGSCYVIIKNNRTLVVLFLWMCVSCVTYIIHWLSIIGDPGFCKKRWQLVNIVKDHFKWAAEFIYIHDYTRAALNTPTYCRGVRRTYCISCWIMLYGCIYSSHYYHYCVVIQLLLTFVRVLCSPTRYYSKISLVTLQSIIIKSLMNLTFPAVGVPALERGRFDACIWSAI